ncbi:MAG: heme NO-binding domain-containing protein [Alphaproteobacteria bacterium]
MINGAMEEMVRMHHGDEAWARIRARAGIDVEVFMSTEAYPDDMTYRLVGAASEELGASRDDVLVAFGEHWITYTASEGYGGLLAANGATLPEFLAELPNFHARVAMIFPALQPPRFACSDVAETSLRLHYWTRREGLAPFVVGLVRGLGRRCGTELEVRLVEARDAGADHDVFEVRWAPPAAAAGAA